MKSLAKQLVVLLTAGVILFLAVQTCLIASVHTSVSETYVYVCDDEGDWRCEENEYFGPISYEGNYIPHVLANEWPSAAGDQALQAGAIAIRTFGWRELGCGAIWGYYPVGSTYYRIEHNDAQVYWGCCTPQTRHYNAVNATSAGVMRRGSDYYYACAKYKADCGNPTDDGSEESYTLVGVPDPVDSATTSNSGMSQNGTHAWELSGYDGAAPWDYRQMLTHYYARVFLSEQPGQAARRWTWLDVDTAGGTRYGRYFGPFTHTPLTMQTGQVYEVPFHIQNTDHYYPYWPNSGSHPVRLSYHWYNRSRMLDV
jgi:hypothetical protein